MSSSPRATAKAAQKPIFQKPDESDVTDTLSVEESQTTLDESDEISDDDPHAEFREEYGHRLDTLELNHEDTGDRITALERIVVGLCDTVLGKGVLPVLPAPEEDVTR